MRFRQIRTGEVFDFTAEQVIIAGYTGRDQRAVRQHIDELAREGVPAPPKVPMIYAEGIEVQQQTVLEPLGSRSSGEVEPVLVVTESGICVALGSDHTDRELEQTDILKSKQACPKVVGEDVIALDDLIDDWDDLRLRAVVSSDGLEEVYQDATMATMLRPLEIVAHIENSGRTVGPGSLVFLGTVPLVTDGFRFAAQYEMSLLDRDDRVLLELRYGVQGDVPRTGKSSPA